MKIQKPVSVRELNELISSTKRIVLGSHFRGVQGGIAVGRYNEDGVLTTGFDAYISYRPGQESHISDSYITKSQSGFMITTIFEDTLYTYPLRSEVRDFYSAEPGPLCSDRDYSAGYKETHEVSEKLQIDKEKDVVFIDKNNNSKMDEDEPFLIHT